MGEMTGCHFEIRLQKTVVSTWDALSHSFLDFWTWGGSPVCVWWGREADDKGMDPANNHVAGFRCRSYPKV